MLFLDIRKYYIEFATENDWTRSNRDNPKGHTRMNLRLTGSVCPWRKIPPHKQHSVACFFRGNQALQACFLIFLGEFWIVLRNSVKDDWQNSTKYKSDSQCACLHQLLLYHKWYILRPHFLSGSHSRDLSWTHTRGAGTSRPAVRGSDSFSLSLSWKHRKWRHSQLCNSLNLSILSIMYTIMYN